MSPLWEAFPAPPRLLVKLKPPGGKDHAASHLYISVVVSVLGEYRGHRTQHTVQIMRRMNEWKLVPMLVLGFESVTYNQPTMFRPTERCSHRPVEAVGWRAKSALLLVTRIWT